MSGCATIYSKPEFRGRIIDAETKEPIEEAVAVVLYKKRPLIGGPAGVSSHVFHAKETLTDSNGEFRIPAYWSVLLFTEDTGVRFIFYKPGHMTDYGPIKISHTLIESYFSAGKVGEEMEIEGGTFEQGNYVKWKGPLGIVELKRVSAEKAMPPGGIPADYGAKELPLLYEAINQDRKNRGLKGQVK